MRANTAHVGVGVAEVIFVAQQVGEARCGWLWRHHVVATTVRGVQDVPDRVMQREDTASASCGRGHVAVPAAECHRVRRSHLHLPSEVGDPTRPGADDQHVPALTTSTSPRGASKRRSDVNARVSPARTVGCSAAGTLAARKKSLGGRCEIKPQPPRLQLNTNAVQVRILLRSGSAPLVGT